MGIKNQGRGSGKASREVFLDRIGKPIRFALAGDKGKIDKIHGLREFVSGQVDQLIGGMSGEPVSDWEALREQFNRFEELDGAERKKRLEYAVSILERLKTAPGPGTSRSSAQSPNWKWETPVQYLKGVGPNRSRHFEKIGIRTVEDLLYYIPWRYDDRSRIVPIAEISPDVESTVIGVVQASRLVVTSRRQFKIFEALIGDGSGSVTVKWFNQPYLQKIIEKGKRIMISGKLKPSRYRGHVLEFENPVYELMGDEESPEGVHTGRVVPVYHERAGWTSRQLRSLIKSVLDSGFSGVPDFLPPDIQKAHDLMPLGEALYAVHFPSDASAIEKLNEGRSPAHRRLVFDEFLLLQLGLGLKRRELAREVKGTAFQTDGPLLSRFIKSLPFALTEDQNRVIGEIKRDMARPRPMNRLLQGDVGCGKTVVASAAMLVAADNGHQAALMAPTEILAEQHFRTFRSWLEPLGLRCEVLTSGRRKAESRAILDAVEQGEVAVLIGTHALIQSEVRFSRLGMVVVDEQHKFGVLQRSVLRKKGYHPDVLVMTATPIPRTLALTVHGDLDLSVIRELPKGRAGIDTVYYPDSRRSAAYGLVAREVARGRQAYVVYPLVEESEKLDLKSAVEMAGRFEKEVFPSFKVGLLHGQMSADEKEKTMKDFKSGNIQILVATTVIEVGIDVPNAAVMVVENAERFGLSQLHQLRGRVGRGSAKSICVLISGRAVSEDARRRLEVMVSHLDGFRIAEEDLLIRGPGEFFGTRQSGLPELRVANIIRDGRVLETAREEAERILGRVPALDDSEHVSLRKALSRKWGKRLELFSVS